MTFIETSAKGGENVGPAFYTIAREIKEKYVHQIELNLTLLEWSRTLFLRTLVSI